ncbi:MAG: PAS domain S-box protein, partial [Kofleriaceae bacterium]|nr:PAS domain S-box protein [Kofleriaceae bacterium]
LVKIEYVVYSIILSAASIFVSRWLNQLINSGKKVVQSEKRFRSLFENGNNAVFILKKMDDVYQIYDVNTFCEKVFGLERSEILGKSPAQGTHQKVRRALATGITAVRRIALACSCIATGCIDSHVIGKARAHAITTVRRVTIRGRSISTTKPNIAEVGLARAHTVAGIRGVANASCGITASSSRRCIHLNTCRILTLKYMTDTRTRAIGHGINTNRRGSTTVNLGVHGIATPVATSGRKQAGSKAE